MLGDEAGVQRHEQRKASMGKIDVASVVVVKEPPASVGRRGAVRGDDGVHPRGVGEEPGGAPVGVDVGHRRERERGGDVDERAGVQHRRGCDGGRDRREQARPVAGVTVLFGPQLPCR